MKVVIINGRGGAGKDTFVWMCRKYVICNSYSSVDKVKEAAEILGWTGGKGLSDRKFLSDLKDLSTWYNDGPFEELKRIYEQEKLADDFRRALKPETSVKILFFHIREPREIERCVKEFNAKTLLIRRPMDGDGEYGNHADDDVENFNYDYICENNGSLEELSNMAKDFVDKVLVEDE